MDRPQSVTVVEDWPFLVEIFMKDGHEAPWVCSTWVGDAACAKALQGRHIAHVFKVTDSGIIHLEADERVLPDQLRVGNSWPVFQDEACKGVREIISVSEDSVVVQLKETCQGAPEKTLVTETWRRGLGCVRRETAAGYTTLTRRDAKNAPQSLPPP